jgi:hypothetical protein
MRGKKRRENFDMYASTASDQSDFFGAQIPTHRHQKMKHPDRTWMTAEPILI